MWFWDPQLFKEIAASNSMSKGAEVCGISQSAATQHVKEVERRLHTTLFDRSKRPLELTEAGKIYAEFSREVLRLEEHMERAIEALEGGGTVRVASIYSIGLTEMTRHIEMLVGIDADEVEVVGRIIVERGQRIVLRSIDRQF